LAFSGPESGKAQDWTKTRPRRKQLVAASNTTPRPTCGKEPVPAAQCQGPENGDAVQGVKTVHKLWRPVSPSFDDMQETVYPGMKSGGERPDRLGNLYRAVGDHPPGLRGVSNHWRRSRTPTRVKATKVGTPNPARLE
jgi:hypothetical protein